MDLLALREKVRSELDGYAIPQADPEGLGTPLSPEWFEERLAQMRNALVEPYWVDVEARDTAEELKASRPLVRRVVVVADDQLGSLVAFDPVIREFTLIESCDGRRTTMNIHGDAVGCFLSR